MANFYTLISFIELVIIIIAIHEDLYASTYMEIFIIHTLLRLPKTISLLDRAGSNIILSFYAGVLVSIFAAFLLGTFDLHNWFLPCILIGTSEVSLLALNKLPKSSNYAIIGMVLGCIPYPLDWPVYWKETPITSVLFTSIGTFIGSILEQ